MGLRSVRCPVLVAAIAVTLVLTLPWVALAASQSVTIQDFSFTPASVTVNVGDSVTWRNTGGDPHTATSNTTGFDTGTLNPGTSKTIVFGTAGTFDYHCAIHPSMRGTVTVLAAIVTPVPTPPPTAAPTPPPTLAPTPPPTIAPTAPPTAVATTTVAPASAPAAPTSASPSPSATATTPASARPAVAAASPSASTAATPAATPVPAGDPGPLPLLVGVLVVAGIGGLAYYGFRRR